MSLERVGGEYVLMFTCPIGFHDKLVAKIKTKANEKMVDGLAHRICCMLRPDIFKTQNHLLRNNQKTRF